jgi:4-hydroxybenzoate polyprenyltransferase
MSTEPTTPQTGDETEQRDETIPVGEPDDPEPVEVVHAPSRLGQVVALVAAVIGVGLTAPFAALALPFSVAGLAIVAGSLFVASSRGWLSVGVGLLLLGAIIAGGYGAVPVEFMLVGVAAALLALDVGQFGIDVGEQLGRGTRTRRLEITHATATVIALTVASAFVYAVYLFAGEGRPASAVALSVIGAIVLMWVYRR